MPAMLRGSLFLITLLFLPHLKLRSQDPYVLPTDSLVLANLEAWQDMKFGLLMHWGPYSQWGVTESWTICSEDEPWCERKGPYAGDYNLYKKKYETLPKTFNPYKFNPEKWASAAKDAGMKYVVFTTKHHDGFCMFDTQQTNYKITGDSCAFHANPKADVTKEIFNSFRARGFSIGAYFSKPDWHNHDYWWPRFATPDRNVNYNTAKYPERWNSFKDYTYKQLEELTKNYGKVDILWLDGGWVRPRQLKNPEWVKSPYSQDIDMHRIAAMARANQPGILIVDRSVGGQFENYVTPEQQIPDSILAYPWETCMPMATSWSYVQGDKYKTSAEIIHNLCKIVARGGNYLLNVAPGPDGDWDPVAYSRLAEIGAWMKVNGEGIYGTEPMPGYGNNKRLFVKKGAKTVYVLCLLIEREPMPPHIKIPFNSNFKSVSILGFNQKLHAFRDKDKIDIEIPHEVSEGLHNAPAYVVKIER